MKRNIYKTAAGAVLMALSMAMTSFGAGQAAREAEDTAAKGPGIAAPVPVGNPVENGEIIPGNLGAAGEADQMVMVVGTGGCNADVSYYRKDENGAWQLAWKEAGIVGRGGITDEKREGDGKTPEGTYRFTMPFGLKDDPGAKLPYHKVRQGDFWVDDSQAVGRAARRIISIPGTRPFSKKRKKKEIHRRSINVIMIRETRRRRGWRRPGTTETIE